jgi:hypothetical protein
VKGWMTGLVVLVCVVTLATLPSSGASSLVTSIQTQLKTAAYHAGELAQKGLLSSSHLHLHHTINCLEGTSGPDYFAPAGYPCKGQGGGAIPDLKTAVDQKVPGAKAALDDANLALKDALEGESSNDLLKARSLAAQAAQRCRQAAGKIGM